MSRRDTIIIAVLLNAGLLIVLFATSLKSESTENEMPVVATTIVAPVPKMEEVKPLAALDEVSQAATQYTPPAITQETAPNFAADLQAIGTLESQLIAPTPAPITEPEVSMKEVRVKKGDVLERIARHNRVSVDELMKANHLSSTRLKIGQVLKIPHGKKGSAPVNQESGESAAKYYVVKNGDNPWTIAVKNRMKVEDLLKLNNLDENQARRLKPGDKLRIQ